MSVIAAVYSVRTSFQYTKRRSSQAACKKVQYLHNELGPDDNNIVNLTYRLLREGRYVSVIMLMDLLDLTKVKEQGLEVYQITLINLAIAYKWHYNQDMCEEILLLPELETDDLKFVMAKFVLRGEYKKAGKLMLVIPVTEIYQDAYNLWPLFREFRKTIWFTVGYKKLFDEEPLTA